MNERVIETAAAATHAPGSDAHAHDPDWYKDAVIYQLHVKAFQDSSGDGVGDFTGLMQRLDYLQELGVTTLWLLPFCPSPLRDDGYDISDYRAVHPAYGSMEEFDAFMAEARRRGLRVITELVVNHTSDQHPWFDRARRAPPGSPERAFYVWSDTDQRYLQTRIIFLDTETSNWTWDPVAGAYFWHRFYSHQPDLNYDNPEVLSEVIGAMRFWLDKGVDGLRLDAVPYLCEREGTNNENLPETHDILRKIRAEIDAAYPDRMLLAEANQWPEDTRPYFGEGDECHMAFHFPLMPRMYMALAQEDRHPITDIMRQTPDIPPNCQWAVFLRNHDELTLEMVTDEERDYLWRTYATDSRARINLGIRRRLAPLMGNDRRKIELMTGLLLSMPGTPVIYYGDEIGMGDNYYLGDRDGVRTPMQWSADRNGGFSRADPQRLYLPPIMDPVYGFQAVNVEAQQRDAASLLNWTRRIIQVRRQYRAFGRGSLNFLYPRNRKVIAYVREFGEERLLCVANLSASAQSAELDLSAYRDSVPVELLGQSAFPPVGQLPYMLTLPAYGFFWFLLTTQAQMPRWYVPPPDPLPEFSTLVVRDGIEGALVSGRRMLEQEILPAFLVRQRWFAGKETRIRDITVESVGSVAAEDGPAMLAFIEVEFADGSRQRYFLPLSTLWGEANLRHGAPMLSYTLARLRKGSKVGALVDAVRDQRLARAVVEAMARHMTQEAAGGAVRFTATEALRQIVAAAPPEGFPVRPLDADQSNVSVAVGDSVLLKVYRRTQPGLQPELEMSRFLSEEAHFANTPPLLGIAEYVAADGVPTALAVAFGFVPNQGDAWTVIVDALARELQLRVIEAPVSAEEPGPAAPPGPFPFPLDMATVIGTRTAEMHLALARDTDDPDFRREPVTKADIGSWTTRAREQARLAQSALEANASLMPAGEIDALRAAVERAFERFDAIAAAPVAGEKTRIHGDYHLGQVLVSKNDVVIIDFEAEPGLPLKERREKSSPMRDVAGMLRSFDYAAWSALDQASALGAEHRSAFETIAFAWRDQASADFLDAYFTTMEAAGRRPEEREAQNALLQLFLLAKGFYEIRYELANRPNWLAIPVRGVLALLGEDER